MMVGADGNICLGNLSRLSGSLLLVGGTVVIPGERAFAADVLVSEVGIEAVGEGIDHDGPSIDCTGCLILPEPTDLHVHLRDPGYAHKETIESGCRAALAGGVTRVAAMPNTRPFLATVDQVAYVFDAASKVGHGVRVEVAGAIVRDRGSSVLSDIIALRDAGCIAVSDDGFSLQDRVLMKEALAASAEADLPFFAHCEDESITGSGSLTGSVAASLGVVEIPEGAETRAVERNIELAEETGASLHILHISEGPSVECVRQAKRSGISVTAEAAPHHLALTSDAAMRFAADAKMSPPLRTERDRQAVIQGLLDGTIDILASDHAPHTADEKAVGLAQAPCGIVGLESLAAVSYTELVVRHGMDVVWWADLLTSGPARVIGRAAPTIAPGAPARLGVFALGTHHIDTTWLFGKGRNTPFIDYPVALRPVLAVAGGRVFTTTWRGN